MDIIEVEDLTVAYDDIPVLWDIDVKFKANKITAIVGPNGAGKSTLVKAILNLVKPLSGNIVIVDNQTKKRYDSISYVPQKESINWDFPATVLDVVEMGRYGSLGWFKRIKKEDRKIAIEAIMKMKMSEYINKHISELSGGQQQRVFLARSLAQNAKIYLMDEPFAGIDKKTEKIIVDNLREMKQNNKTIIVVHHDLNTVTKYFDEVVLINKEIIAAGPTEKVFTKDNIAKTFALDSKEEVLL